MIYTISGFKKCHYYNNLNPEIDSFNSWAKEFTINCLFINIFYGEDFTDIYKLFIHFSNGWNYAFDFDDSDKRDEVYLEIKRKMKFIS